MDAGASGRARRRLSVIGLAAVVLGIAGMGWGFATAIGEALNGREPSGFLVVFFAGAALVAAAIVIGVIGVVRPGSNALPILTLGLATLPILGIILTLGVARGAS
jgi:hypothetical protein